MTSLRRIESTPVRVAGAALMAVSTGMAVSAVVALVDGGGAGAALAWSAALTAAVGTAMLAGAKVSRRSDAPLSYATVAWSWVAVSVAGALPFLLSGTIGWADVDNALFESVSGFTCTGATVLDDIDAVPQGLLFFRSMTQWFGGMGLIVLAVAVLPALKVGGLELIAGEAPGPTADRLTPRISETARRLWFLYGAVTVVVAAALALAGLSPFDAVAHAFSTVATGGFSTHSASIAYFDSFVVELVVMAGMVYCGMNFAMHWHLIAGGQRSFRGYSELRWYVGILLAGAVLLVLVNGAGAPAGDNVRQSLFYAASLGSSTGFGTSDYTAWLPAAQMVVLLLMVVGGMTGSTAGGLKVLRLQLTVRYAVREVLRARYPRAVLPMRIGEMNVAEQVAARAIGFVLLYMGLVVVGGVAVTALGADPLTGFSGALAAIANMGPALGAAGPADTALEFPRAARPILAVLMMFGRLEVFPAMLMFVAAGRAVARSRRDRLPA
ncbi:MAG TPA: potassium transporter, partial [Acidimicrobiaceae bacterium]|nr:potassium transporter [Acidimicrobiaceae bacterium]HCB37646.1 potassium transporter [Acidimicrobiaceae bacterium]